MYKPKWSCEQTKWGPEITLTFGELELRRIIARDAIWKSEMSWKQLLLITIRGMSMSMQNKLVPCSNVCLFDFK